NKPQKKSFRQQLRNEPTQPEWLLCQELKGSKLGYKFRRQHGVGPYVVDFYCSEIKLVVEVDGDTHFEPTDVEYDNQRTEYLTQNNIQVLRVTNVDVRESMEDVVELIKQQFPHDHNHP
ncbi:MAG TPA: endonuclease domain-containing protein, partial [Patescibacteria group bacterium]|nr:endonuclease domain-containing protein [Patescibacteria group bacterium]